MPPDGVGAAVGAGGVVVAGAVVVWLEVGVADALGAVVTELVDVGLEVGAGLAPAGQLTTMLVREAGFQVIGALSQLTRRRVPAVIQTTPSSVSVLARG